MRMILVISPKNVYFAKRFKEECKNSNQKYRIVELQELVTCNFKINIQDFDALYIRYPYLHGSPKYLPNLIKIAKQFKQSGKLVVDSNIVEGKIGEGKWMDYLALKKAKVPIPNTAILTRKSIPKTWPFILKWIYGLKAKQVFYISNQLIFEQVYNSFPKKELLVQEYIKAKYEYKVVTVGYRSLPVVLRFKILKVDFRIDFENFEVLELKKIPKITKLAESASRILGRELAKVDILEDGKKLYVLEVNRFPGLDSFEQLTGYNVIKEFLKYLTKNK